MISSGGDFARARAIRVTEVAATGRPESAALIVAGLNLASLARSEADHPRHAISKRRRPACTVTLIGCLRRGIRHRCMPPLDCWPPSRFRSERRSRPRNSVDCLHGRGPTVLATLKSLCRYRTTTVVTARRTPAGEPKTRLRTCSRSARRNRSRVRSPSKANRSSTQKCRATSLFLGGHA